MAISAELRTQADIVLNERVMGVAHPINHLFARVMFHLETCERVDEMRISTVDVPDVVDAGLGFLFGHNYLMAVLRLQFVIFDDVGAARHGYPCSFRGAAAGDVEEEEAYFE